VVRLPGFRGQAWTNRIDDISKNGPRSVAPLVCIDWTRYLAELARRLFQENELASISLPEESSRNHLTNWLRNNRYHAFWRQAVLNTVH
jgi:hypothetical protein